MGSTPLFLVRKIIEPLYHPVSKFFKKRGRAIPPKRDAPEQVLYKSGVESTRSFLDPIFAEFWNMKTLRVASRSRPRAPVLFSSIWMRTSRP